MGFQGKNISCEFFGVLYFLLQLFLFILLRSNYDIAQRLLKKGPDHKAYYHECFLRGRSELCTLMVRLVNPGKRIPDKDREPDFYDISSKAPLPDSFVPPIPAAKIVNTQVLSRSKKRGSPLALERSTSSSVGDHLDHQTIPPEAFRLYQQFGQALPSTTVDHWQGNGAMAPFLDTATNSMMKQVGTLPPQCFIPATHLSNSANGTVCSNECNSMASFQQQVESKYTSNLSSLSDWLEEALPSAKSSRIRSHSFLSQAETESPKLGTHDPTIFDKCDLSLYDVEPDPLPEGVPLKVKGSDDDDLSLSNIKDPCPLLKEFAEIYFSKPVPPEVFCTEGTTPRMTFLPCDVSLETFAA